MTMWEPSLERARGPRYRAIAQALARDIREGRLESGARLPTHRALATQLGVTVGTVSRAYAEAARLGLLSGEVGRGSFVRAAPPVTRPALEDERPGRIDLSLNLAGSPTGAEPLRRALAALAGRRDLAALLEYQPAAGTLRHREAGARWIQRPGLDSSPDQIVVTSGAQHAMMVALCAVAQPGDVVLCEALTYPGMTDLAHLLRLRLQGVAIDAGGVQPEAFEAACRSSSPVALYCVPTLQNPTAAIMPQARRREIAAIARRYGVALIEDDCYGFLPSRAPAPLSCHAPERSYYLTSLSKSVAPGLRVGYLRAPLEEVPRVAASVRAMMRMAAPLMAEIASLWIHDGTALRRARECRQEIRARGALARRVLPGIRAGVPAESPHLWLSLPEPWRAEEFCAECRAQGILLMPAEAFAVGRASAPQAVRISIGAARSRAELERGLTVLAELLGREPRPAGRAI